MRHAARAQHLEGLNDNNLSAQADQGDIFVGVEPL